MGGKEAIVSNGWATDKEIDLFRCTAHNVDGAGEDARHGVKEKINPTCKRILSLQDPMALSYAKFLTRRILNNWIKFNCP